MVKQKLVAQLGLIIQEEKLPVAPAWLRHPRLSFPPSLRLQDSATASAVARGRGTKGSVLRAGPIRDGDPLLQELLLSRGQTETRTGAQPDLDGALQRFLKPVPHVL